MFMKQKKRGRLNPNDLSLPKLLTVQNRRSPGAKRVKWQLLKNVLHFLPKANGIPSLFIGKKFFRKASFLSKPVRTFF